MTSSSAAGLQLVWPAQDYLESYCAALERGWSPDNLRAAAAAEELQRIKSDPQRFLAAQVDREAAGDPITLPDGSRVARLPGYRRWLCDGEFCGVISLRWQKNSNALPDYCLGHIGFSVVPWKQRRGYATQALRLLLPEARDEGLQYVEITTHPDNRASQRVIAANGGELIEQFTLPAVHGGGPSLRYRIALS
jgi:predicted acetyltransferase